MKTFVFHFIVAFTATYLFFSQADLPIPYNAETTTAMFLGILTLLWLSALFYNKSYFRKLPKAINLLLYFLKELFLANIKVAFDIVTPHYYMRPTIIALPLTVKSDLEITLLANIITLTPGTLSIDVRKDKKILFLHALYVKDDDIEQLKNYIKHGFERRILELTA
ncbi:Na+/H+ antiporter subunit E [Pontibacter silvestris]|uniref:Na+/H+ antiporter subunit E n=1 Tax=Pontibacter silvestris TaxID=2305183 RepID=A0ABW4WY36_9BACT|nr:Na+/H+ antiporter subunit E [Pontibacter silvestris]MCC9135318.1 Na+/H+ antiporter subunit E [Pontibacter silvestris]